jgi:glucokinase
MATTDGAGPNLDRASGADGEVVLGLDFGGSKVAAALCGLGGEIQRQSVIATDPALGAMANLDRALGLARAVLQQPPLDGAARKLVAVGACTFGIPAENGVALSPAIPGWDKLPLRRHLEDAFGAPVVLLTDVKAAASAEASFGALVGANPGIYLNLGTGLAAAIVEDGSVVSGAHGASGEIGYNLREVGDVWGSDDIGGPMLEDVVSGMGLAAALAGTAGNASASDAFRRRHEPAVGRIVDEFLRELAFHLVNLTVAIDPERIAVGGGMVRSWDVLEDPLRRALLAHVPFPPELVVGAFPYDAALRGAVRAGVELALGLPAPAAAVGAASREDPL